MPNYESTDRFMDQGFAEEDVNAVMLMISEIVGSRVNRAYWRTYAVEAVEHVLLGEPERRPDLPLKSPYGIRVVDAVRQQLTEYLQAYRSRATQQHFNRLNQLLTSADFPQK